MEHLRLLEREAADLGQSEWNHTFNSSRSHTIPDRDTSALESSVAGSWRIETGEQSQASSAVDGGDGPRGPEGGDSSGKCL